MNDAPKVADAGEVLKPCPWCGAQAEIDEHSRHRGYSSVACSSKECKVQPITDYLYTHDAIAAWNTRAESALEAENRQLKEQVRKLSAPVSDELAVRLLKHYRSSYWHKRCTMGTESPWFDHRCPTCKQTDKLLAARTQEPAQTEGK